MQEDPDFYKSDAAQKHLRNKRRGGDNNAQGNRYEEYFALAEIVRFAAERWEERELIIFSEQAEDTFVDDLKVVEPACQHFYQLKSGQNETWGAPLKVGTICCDFYCQLCQGSGSDFHLYLVVAQEDLYQTLNNEIPLSISSHTNVRYFPFCKSTIELLETDINFKSHLVQISRGGNNISKLDALAKTLLGNWVGSERRDIALSDILDTPLVKSDEVLSVSLELQSCLNQIQGVVFTIMEDMLEWKTPPLNNGTSLGGVIRHPIGSPEFSTWENALLANPPRDLRSFVLLLP